MTPYRAAARDGQPFPIPAEPDTSRHHTLLRVKLRALVGLTLTQPDLPAVVIRHRVQHVADTYERVMADAERVAEQFILQAVPDQRATV